MDPIALEDVADLLPAPIPAAREAEVEGWVKAMSAWLLVRYTNAPRGTPQVEAARRDVALARVAGAIARRIERTPLMVQQTAGPFSGRWSERAATDAWFMPEVVEELDAVFGVGGTRTYRTPAPRATWAGNRARDWEGDPDVWTW